MINHQINRPPDTPRRPHEPAASVLVERVEQYVADLHLHLGASSGVKARWVNSSGGTSRGSSSGGVAPQAPMTPAGAEALP